MIHRGHVLGGLIRNGKKKKDKRPTIFGTAALCFFLSATTVSSADTVAKTGVVKSGGWRLGIGPIGGAMALDQRLNDFRWDTRVAFQSGAAATIYRGRFAGGFRVWRAHTTQDSGIPGVALAPRVNLTGVEFLGKLRVADYRGIELWGLANSGRLHLGYDPDELTFEPGGPANPITVAFKPISEWDFGVGTELRTELARHMALTVQVERWSFALDTSHRVGSEIVESRDRFYNWHLRLEVAWLLRLR